jgi:hypothetical protein
MMGFARFVSGRIGWGCAFQQMPSFLSISLRCDSCQYTYHCLSTMTAEDIIPLPTHTHSDNQHHHYRSTASGRAIHIFFSCSA